jgi:hypothetical protein
MVGCTDDADYLVYPQLVSTAAVTKHWSVLHHLMLLLH